MEHMMVKRILDIGLFHNRIEVCSQGKEKLQSINRLLPLKKNNNSAAGAKEVERWTAKVKYGFRLVAETDCILFYQKDIWRICFSKEVSKHGKGNGSEIVII